MLSIKHYNKIAMILGNARKRVSDTAPEITYEAINGITYDLIDYFTKDNPNFNENKFCKKIREK